MLITNSEITSFRTCPNRWGFRYVDLLTTGTRATAASWGTLGHEGIRWAWRKAAELKEKGLLRSQPNGISLDDCILAAERGVQAKAEELLAQIIDGDEDTEDQICAQCEEVQDGIGGTVRGMWEAMQTHRLLGTEIDFKVPIPDTDGDEYAGQIDLVTYDPDNQRIVVWDHKFTASVDAYEGRLQLDTQSAGYVWAVEELQKLGFFKGYNDEPVGTFIWSLSRRKVPSTPRINKLSKKAAKEMNMMALYDQQEAAGEPMGYVSHAACDTLPHVYLGALVEQEAVRFLPRTPEQLERLVQIEHEMHRWYKQEEHIIAGDQISRWGRELLVTLEQMKAAAKNRELRIRNPGACAYSGSFKCDYDQVCLMDAPETRALYQVRTKKHAEIQEGTS